MKTNYANNEPSFSSLVPTVLSAVEALPQKVTLLFRQCTNVQAVEHRDYLDCYGTVLGVVGGGDEYWVQVDDQPTANYKVPQGLSSSVEAFVLFPEPAEGDTCCKVLYSYLEFEVELEAGEEFDPEALVWEPVILADELLGFTPCDYGKPGRDPFNFVSSSPCRALCFKWDASEGWEHWCEFSELEEGFELEDSVVK